MADQILTRQERRKQSNDRYRAKIGVLATPQEIECKRCGNRSTVPTKRHRYCSDCRSMAEGTGPSSHYYLSKTHPPKIYGVEVSCGVCGEGFIRRAAAHRFCSPACLGIHQSRAAKEPRNLINNRMRAGMWASIKGKKAGRSWQKLVGYSTADLILHLERQFQRGMTWDNFGDWHIDHRRPLASFSFTGPDDPEFKEAWALTNLQPLWAQENIAKRARITFLL